MTDERIAAAKRDLVVSLVFIVVGILAIVNINSSETGKIVDTGTLTHATLPTLYGSLIILLAGIVLVGALYKLISGRYNPLSESDVPESESDAEKTARRIVVLRLWGTLVLLLVYVFLLAYVYFILLTTLFLAVLFVLFGRRQPVKIAVASIAGGSAFYLLFILILKLPL